MCTCTFIHEINLAASYLNERVRESLEQAVSVRQSSVERSPQRHLVHADPWATAPLPPVVRPPDSFLSGRSPLHGLGVKLLWEGSGVTGEVALTVRHLGVKVHLARLPV